MKCRFPRYYFYCKLVVPLTKCGGGEGVRDALVVRVTADDAQLEAAVVVVRNGLK